MEKISNKNKKVLALVLSGITLVTSGCTLANNKVESKEESTIEESVIKTGVSIKIIDDVTREEIFGALLSIRDCYNEEICRWTNSVTGNDVIDLVEGNYKLTEIVSPEGYNVIDEPISFKVEPNQITDICIENKSKQNLVSITNVDIDTDQIIPGMVLSIFKGNKEIKKQVASNKPTNIRLDNGTYMVVAHDLLEEYYPQTVQFSVNDKSGNKMSNVKLGHKLISKTIETPKIMIK